MMHFGWTRWLYDWTVIAYAGSLTLFFSDVLQPSSRRSVNRMALLLLFVAFLTVTGLLLARFQMMHMFPAYTRSDLLLLIAWILLITTLVLDTFFRIGLVLFFTNVVGFFIFLLAGYQPGGQSAEWFPKQDLLLLHVLLAIFSETAFAFSFAFAVMHILQHNNLTHKRWNRWFLLLPSLARLDSLCFVLTSIGFFLLFAAMAVGFVWGKLVLHEWVVFSEKTIVTVLTWLMYGVYLFLRARDKSGSRNMMIFQVICFAATLFNLLFVSDITPTHDSF